MARSLATGSSSRCGVVVFKLRSESSIPTSACARQLLSWGSPFLGLVDNPRISPYLQVFNRQPMPLFYYVFTLRHPIPLHRQWKPLRQPLANKPSIANQCRSYSAGAAVQMRSRIFDLITSTATCSARAAGTSADCTVACR